jgi:hypothetical protein
MGVSETLPAMGEVLGLVQELQRGYFSDDKTDPYQG